VLFAIKVALAIIFLNQELLYNFLRCTPQIPRGKEYIEDCMRARFCDPPCKGIISIWELIFKVLVESCCFAIWNSALES
jgi:hypothetical protein